MAPFLFGIAVFTILFMATGPIFDMANLIIQYGVPFLDVMKYAAVRLPSFIAYTLPMSVLLAGLIAFGRLSVDQEITALKAGGVSFYRLLVPLFTFAVFAAGISYLLNTYIGPESLYHAKIIASENAKGHLPQIENIKLSSTTDDGLQRITIAKSFNEEDGMMRSPVVNDYTQDGNLLRITHAQEARWDGKSWELINGETLQFDSRGLLNSRMAFQTAQFYLPQTPHQVGLSERSPEEMSSPLLKQTIRVLQQDPKRDPNQIRMLRMMYEIRQAVPVACLIFALIGAPSGIRPVRSSSGIGVAISVLIVLIYYFFLAICNSLGDHGTLTPLIAAWLPNFVFLIVGAVFLMKEST